MSFLVSIFAASVTIVCAFLPPLSIPGLSTAHADVPPFPAPPGYLLPWAGGEIHTVTQGEQTTLTHNGYAAYAFDFDLTYDTVVAARGGRVALVRMDSNIGGCSPAFSGDANYIVIDHGDGTSALYLHLAQNGVFVKPGDLVWQGQIIGISGETGLTCSGINANPGPHLHFQVELTQQGHYFTQSLPIAFDDIADNNGVPQEGHSYISGNYGHGNQHPVTLTLHHDVRPFAPIAAPANPALIEGLTIAVPPLIGAPPAPVPNPTESAPATATDTAATATLTPRPTHTPTRTPTADPSSTPVPTDTPTPTPSDTPTPTATDTPPPPTPTDTPTPDPAPSVTPTP